MNAAEALDETDFVTVPEMSPEEARAHAHTRRIANLRPNPAGRPKGSRNRFSEAFYRDMAETWQEQGIEVMQRVAKDDPSTFLRVAASLLPRVVEAQVESTYHEMSDDELRAIIAAAAANLSVADGSS